MHKFRDLTSMEWSEYKTHSERLHEFIADEQVFALIVANMKAFVELRHAHRVAFQNAPSTYQNPARTTAFLGDMNRGIINFLFSISLYNEHMGIVLDRRAPSLSISFKAKQSELYDTNFAYRFLIRMRNFVAHHGMPVGSVFMSVAEISETEAELRMDVNFTRDKLLEGRYWSTVRTDLEQMPERFSAEEQLVEMFKCMVKLHRWVIHEQLPGWLKSASWIEELIAPVKDKEGAPMIFTGFDTLITESLRREAGDPDVGNSTVGVTRVPMDLVAKLRHIQESQS